MNEKNVDWSLGPAISNVGKKVSYIDDQNLKEFNSTNLGVGTSVNVELNDKNDLALSLDLNKLLVPTPDSLGDFRNKIVLN